MDNEKKNIIRLKVISILRYEFEIEISIIQSINTLKRLILDKGSYITRNIENIDNFDIMFEDKVLGENNMLIIDTLVKDYSEIRVRSINK